MAALQSATSVQSPISKKNKCRSDVDYINMQGESIHLDTAIVSPLSIQALEKGSHAMSGVAAKLYELYKINKYNPFHIIPLIWEHGGREGARAREWVKSQLPSGHVRSQAAQSIWQTLSVTVQRANARTIRTITTRYNGGSDPGRPH